MVQDNYKLIKLAAGGDKNAFEALIKKYDRKVITLALKYTRSEEDAKDIYQEVFIRVYKNISKFEFKSEFSTWLFRIATNVCLTHIEKNKKQQTVDLLSNDSMGDEDDSSTIELADNEPNPEMALGNSELSEAIKKAVETLSAKQKLVFTLKHYEGYKLKEIAEMTGLVEGTVKRYLLMQPSR
ncbi:RNA polymerase sigma factor RpoE [Ignavibacteriales bacterium]